MCRLFTGMPDRISQIGQLGGQANAATQINIQRRKCDTNKYSMRKGGKGFALPNIANLDGRQYVNRGPLRGNNRKGQIFSRPSLDFVPTRGEGERDLTKSHFFL